MSDNVIKNVVLTSAIVEALRKTLINSSNKDIYNAHFRTAIENNIKVLNENLQDGHLSDLLIYLKSLL